MGAQYNKGRAGLIYGADYNPDQWLHDPAVLREDIRLMKLAGITAVSVGIFAWSAPGSR
jgi:beta-galactosidase